LIDWHRITVDEFNRILEHTTTLRNHVFYSLLYWCGLRCNEALSLLANGSNIDFENGQVHLKSRPGTQTMPPFVLKDKEPRSIPIPKLVLSLLIQLNKEHNSDCPYLLIPPERWKVVQQTWKKMRQEGRAREWQNWRLVCNPLRDFKIYCKRAGIQTDEKINLHGLRKGWACNLAEKGIAPKTLCELGGWSDPSVLHEYYSKATDANRDRARQVLDELMGE